MISLARERFSAVNSNWIWERCEAGKKRNMKWNGTPGLLYGLSLCCNVEVRFVRETFMNSAGYRPQRARQSTGLKKRKCSALVGSHELLRDVWQA